MEKITIGLLVIVILQLVYVMYKQQTRKVRIGSSRPLFMDTSALIDGRIIALGESGFISDTLMVPRSVIGELQLLADGSDHEKRSRARYGLDVVKMLQDMKTVNVEIYPDDRKVPEGVDNRLLALAKDNGGAICTVDFNLNKVAQLEEIEILNVNELSKSLRMAYLPGEHAMIELTQKGQDSGQAVGYLGDGTMVVIDGADKKIGKTVEVEFIRSLQTVAGRMMFAKLIADPAPAKPKTLTAKLAGRKPVRSQSKQQSSDKKNDSSSNRNQKSNHESKNTSVRPNSNGSSRSSNASTSSNQTSRNQQPRRRKKSMREQREDSLLELVNKQQ